MRDYIQAICGPLDQQDWEKLEAIIRQETVPKGDFLLRQGTICRHIWYLEKGAVRFFEYADGNEQSTHFFLAPAMFTSYHSLISRSSSELFIKAETECILQSLPYEKLSTLYDSSHKLERVGRIMAELQFMAEFDRRRMHLHMDALERYEHLESLQPEVFRHFQLKDIATYLGITPVSLSRLRNYRMKRPK